jgi:hypothetical protein
MARTRSAVGKRLTISLEMITPDMAADLLAVNVSNRNVRQRRVDQYARDMQVGRWQPTGEPITISDTGKLLNGQHRLMAVVQAGVTVLGDQYVSRQVAEA